jgi:peptidoglycan/xylan/chitin deacetylase (PgdA/CDA1 family)
MFKRILMVGALVLPLISCSSKPVHDANHPEQREPASLEDQYEVAFQNIIQDVSQSARNRTDFLNRIFSLHERTEGEVRLYEAELNRAIRARRRDPNASFDIETSSAYRQIAGLRIALSHQINIMTFIYRRLYQTVTDLSLPEEMRGRAERILNGLNLSLRNLTPVQSLWVEDLMESLDEVALEFESAAVEKKSDRMPASVHNSWREVKQAYAKYEKTGFAKIYEKHRKEIERLGKAAVAANNVEFPAVQFPKNEGRTPSAERYAPGVGLYGNVIGRSFPAGLYSLTYDDGPNSSSTVRLLDLLKAHRDNVNTNGAPATMFWLTKMINANPASVEKAKSLGFPINSHSWSHANLPTLDSAGRQHEINEAITVAQQRVGNQPATGSSTFRFFRCPYGACYSPASPAIRQTLANLNLIHAYWTVDSLDWKYKSNPAKTFDLAKKGMQASGKGVVLFHDIHDGSVEATRMLLNWIKQQNQAGTRIRLKTLEGAVDEYNGSVQ